jgi:hypothetical protein
MSRSRRPIPRTIGLVALLVVMGAALFAQDREPTVRPKLMGDKANTTLYLFLRTGPDENEKTILKDLKSALDASFAKYSGELKLKTVSPGFYDELAGLADQAGAAPTAADGPMIRRIAAQETMYELSMDPAQNLKLLSVKFKGADKPAEYKPGRPGDKTPLTLIVPGKYAFSPPAGSTPMEYTMTLEELGKADTTKTAPWPAADKHFVVTLKNFVGDQEQLFAKLRDKSVVPNVFDVKRSEDLLFAFASLNSTAEGIGEDTITNDRITLGAENLKTSDVRRVWALYPLLEKDVQSELEKFSKFDSVQLGEEIRKNSVPVGSLPNVSPDEPAKWYELQMPPNTNNSRFVRELKVDNLFDFAAKYPTIGKLLVWEFDNGTGNQRAIQVVNPKKGDSRTFVLDRMDTTWQNKVKQAKEKK